jgi:5-formyltetrahydrofolate cyclo-ligase
MDSAEEKRRIRGVMREKRRALSAVIQQRHARQLKAFVQHQSWFQNAQDLGFYCAIDGEISLAPLIKLCWKRGKRVYLPCVGHQQQMCFRRYDPGASLRPNRYGILEPSLHQPAARIETLDIIFVPIVAFTDDGRRLGMGGGYFDRALSRGQLRRRSRPRGPIYPEKSWRDYPLLVGVAHSCQRESTLPRDDWDVGMDLIVTEKGRPLPR